MVCARYSQCVYAFILSVAQNLKHFSLVFVARDKYTKEAASKWGWIYAIALTVAIAKWKAR